MQHLQCMVLLLTWNLFYLNCSISQLANLNWLCRNVVNSDGSWEPVNHEWKGTWLGKSLDPGSLEIYVLCCSLIEFWNQPCFFSDWRMLNPFLKMIVLTFQALYSLNHACSRAELCSFIKSVSTFNVKHQLKLLLVFGFKDARVLRLH